MTSMICKSEISGQHRGLKDTEDSEIEAHIQHTEFIIDLLVVDQYRIDNDENYESPIAGDGIILLRHTTEILVKLLGMIKV